MKNIVLGFVIVLSFQQYSNALGLEREIAKKTAQLAPEEFFIHQAGTADGIIVSLTELRASNALWDKIKNTDLEKGKINIPLVFSAEIIKKAFSGLFNYRAAVQDISENCHTVPKFRILKALCINRLKHLEDVVQILEFLDFERLGKIEKIYDDAITNAVYLGISI